MNAETLPVAVSRRWADFVELTKPRITAMVVLTTAVGFLLAAPPPLDGLLLFHALVGTALVAGGASAWNQVVERERDARMRRTANRPLPAGRLEIPEALLFTLVISVGGVAYLALACNGLTALLGALTLLGYVFVYTPMKRVSSLATLVGAVPGAVPPMMGCAAASGRLDPLAWALFGILFLWQMPHFLAIAWLFRADYERGGFRVLTAGDDPGARTARQMVLYSAALLPVSLLPSVFGASGPSYFLGALFLGLGFLACACAFAVAQSMRSARRLLLASVLYLPVVLLLLVVDRTLF